MHLIPIHGLANSPIWHGQLSPRKRLRVATLGFENDKILGVLLGNKLVNQIQDTNMAKLRLESWEDTIITITYGTSRVVLPTWKDSEPSTAFDSNTQLTTQLIPEADSWLQQQFGKPYRLAWIEGIARDSFKCLILNEMSVRVIAQQCKLEGFELDTTAWRADIIVSATPPFGEDRWEEMLILDKNIQFIRKEPFVCNNINLRDPTTGLPLNQKVFDILRHFNRRLGFSRNGKQAPTIVLGYYYEVKANHGAVITEHDMIKVTKFG